jgi:pyruvate dehydrogenase (quinone)
MAKELATQLVEQLQAAGVQRIYGIVGDSLNPIVDAVRKTGGSQQGGIDWIHVRQEEADTFDDATQAEKNRKLEVRT